MLRVWAWPWKVKLPLALLGASGLALFLIYRGIIAFGSEIPTTPPMSDSQQCRPGDPLANVHKPKRLRVVTACVVVRGTVALVFQDGEDGDYHVNVQVDDEFEVLLNKANRVQLGTLLAEVVPADQEGCTPGQPPRPPSDDKDFGLCTGANVAIPAVGDHVEFTGPYVLDSEHGWMEIHPVWHIEKLR
jgi:hypothetical protein